MDITHLLAGLETGQGLTTLLPHLLWKAHLLKENLAVPIRMVATAAGVAVGLASVKDALQGAVLEQRRAREASGRALVCYIQLNRHCSEEGTYQRLATFVKTRVPLEDHSSIERMLAHDRQSLLEIAQGLLVHDPNVIDKI